MLILLLTVTLGMAEAGKLFFESEQPLKGGDILCPDHKKKCPSSSTCCPLVSGDFACCKFEKAICCPDHIHCCPQGFSCDVEKQRCVMAMNDDTIPWATKKESVPITSVEATEDSNNLLCPDQRSVCSGTSSCCRTYTGDYRCCQYPNDVCCSDGYSCCPRCTICDLLQKRCVTSFAKAEWKSLTDSIPSVIQAEIHPAAIKIPATKVIVNDGQSSTPDPLEVVWCDSTHNCPDGYTCCRLTSGQWGCCPLPAATCCTGSNFCCPQGKQCTNPPGGCY